MLRICIGAIILLAALAVQGSPLPNRTGILFDSPGIKASDYTEFCPDNNGYMWIGTKRGLIRFDGNDCDLYTHDAKDEGSLSDQRTLDLLCDSKGRLWVATANGLNLYDPTTNKFRTVMLDSHEFNGYMIAVDEQPDGTITFLCSGMGLYVVQENEDGELAAVRFMPQFDEQKAMNTLECGRDGKLYIGDVEGNVHVMAKNGARTVVKVGESYVNDIELEADGNLLVNIDNDIFRIDSRTFMLDKLLFSNPVKVLKLSNCSADGFVYVGTMKGGVWRIRPGRDVIEPCDDLYSPSIDIGKSKVSAVFPASDKTLWLGCDYRGVLMVPPHGMPFTYHVLSDYYSDFNGGIDFLSQWEGNSLVATEGRLSLISPRGKLLRTYPLPDDSRVTSLCHIGGDRFLAGMPGIGVKELSMHTGAWNNVIDLPGSYLHLFLETDGADRIFMGLHGKGVLCFNRITGEKLWLKVGDGGLVNNYVNTLRYTSDGILWVGVYSGLSAYDIRNKRYVKVEQEHFTNATVNAIEISGDSLLLLGTSQGIMEYNPLTGGLKRYASPEGLSDNDVRNITIDRNGIRWIGTVNGISRQDPKTKKILAYYGSCGIRESSFTHAALAPGNVIHFANDLGFTIFNPEDIPTYGSESEVKLSAIYMNGKFVVPADMAGGRHMIEGNPLKPERINLPYNDNSLRLRFSTMDFRDGSNMVYRWRVKDLGKEWITTRAGENAIHLPNLDSGDHLLQIQGMRNGVLTPVTEIRIHVECPWYLSWWAIVLYVLILLALLVFAAMLVKKKRTERENDEKIKFFVNLSHDIRSPLTLMISPVEGLLNRPLDDGVKRELKTVKRNGQRILSLVNQMIDLRKLDKGKMQLHCRLTDVPGFVGELVELFQPQARQKNIELEYDNKFDGDRIWLDRDNVDKILVNLISNAIKFTPDGGKVRVLTEETEDPLLGKCLRLSVTDTGIGLDPKSEKKVFERFYQAGKNNGSSGFGIGLDLCRGLALCHHGSIEGHNRTDGVAGSVFSVCLPLSRRAYAEDELIEVPETGMQSGRSADIVSTVEASARESDTPSRRKSGTMKKVLVVDDHEELRDYLCRKLSEYYKVRTASGGEEALKTIRESMPDIVVCDVVMPGMDGLELLKIIKRNATTTHVPVILLSSHSEVADRMVGWSSGADGYLGKPFSLDELESMIDTLIDNRQRVKGKVSGASETDGKISYPEVKGNDELLMERVMKVADKYIADTEFNVEKLAQEAGISRAHLHRKMKDAIGISPSDFIRNIRLKRAAELLCRPDIEITQIAYMVGYNSQPHFSTLFKKFTGFTPSEYRNKYVTDGNSDIGGGK